MFRLLPGHFQGKDGHGFLGALGHVQGDVQGKGGLAHTGPGSQENEVGFVQSRDLLIHGGEACGLHGGEACGQARQVVFTLAHLAEPVQHVRQHLAQRHHVLGALASADGVDLLLGGFQDIPGLPKPLLDQGGDLRSRLGNAPQQRLVPDDGHILHDVGAGGGDLHQLG